MWRVLCLTCAIVASSLIAESHAAEPVIQLGSSTSQLSGRLTTSPDPVAHTLSCVMETLDLAWQTRPSPWQRARREVAAGELDGYFTAMQTATMDTLATLSAPLVLENWYWIQRHGEDPALSDARIGAIRGSHQAEWFRRNHIEITAVANSLEQLIRLLDANRIDLLAADYEDFQQALAALQIPDTRFDTAFLGYIALGVYFSHEFLSQHPSFLQRFNQAIYPCAPDAFELPQYEREKLLAMTQPFIDQWREDPQLLEAVRQQNQRHRGIRQHTILQRDAQWIKEFQTGELLFAKTILNTPLSQRLRASREASNGLITEVIVMDEHGANVAVSDLTSDYWQGNEAKYLQTFHQAADFRLVESVMLDESTKRFQAQISLPLYDPEEGLAIGAITLGVDIEKALSE